MRRRAAWLAVLALAALLPIAAPRPVPASAATTSGPAQRPTGVPYTVTAGPTIDVDDGQLATVMVKTTSAFPVLDIQMQLCRPGVVYQSSDREDPAPDFARGRANCPRVPVSSSGSGFVDDSLEGAKNAVTPEGETLSFYMGEGSSSWTEPDGAPPPTHSLTCDVANPCVLVVEVLATPANTFASRWEPWVFDVRYKNADLLQSCGGIAPGAITMAGPERMTDAYVNWTSEQCHLPGQVGAAGQFSATGEGDAMQQFSSGQADLAYSAVGYDAQAALDPGDPSLPGGGHRPAVAVPVGLNATVMAVGNGEYVRGHKRNYESMSLTTDEAAHMVAQSAFGMDQQAIIARNPPMTSVFADIFGGLVATTAKADATTFLASRYFQRLSPGQWITPRTSDFKDVPGQLRPVWSSFATATPTFANVLSTQTSVRSAVRKALVSSAESNTGGLWLLTDRSTAESLGLTQSQITNGQGAPVLATRGSMNAAVSQMVPDEQGVLLPDPNTAGPATTAAGVLAPSAGDATTASPPYPLTFVEYVFVPAEPLVDDLCAPRTTSQELLKRWLTYLVGAGQHQLPPGMEPLPAALQAQAFAAIEKVGATPSSKVCPAAPPPSTVPDTTPAAASDDGRNVLPGFDHGSSFGDSSSSATGSGDSSTGGTSGATGDSSSAAAAGSGSSTSDAGTATAAGSPPGTAAPESVAAQNAAAELPAYGGSRSGSALLTVVAFLAIMTMVSVAAAATSGRLQRRRGEPASTSGSRGGAPG